jgi:2-polyprenyl-6-methoxyphenol hydroxylase-like FAD-dependent oxidoreductase
LNRSCPGSDAGYLKDLITAQGINEAFRVAERCAVALNECLTGARSFDQAMIDYQRNRDAKVLPMYEFTRQLASLDPPPEMQRISAMQR